MNNSDNTLILIVLIAIFTVTFIISALITYRIRRKKSEIKSPERKEKPE